MSVVSTDLRTTKDRARELRFEASGVFTQRDVQKAIEQLAALGIAPIPTPVNATPYALQPTDYLLEINVANAVIVPGSATLRNGLPVFLKDITGNAHATGATFQTTVDGIVNPQVLTDYGIVGFYPSGANWRFR